MLKTFREYILEGVTVKKNTTCSSCGCNVLYCIKPIYCFKRHQYCYGCNQYECKICKYFLKKKSG